MDLDTYSGHTSRGMVRLEVAGGRQEEEIDARRQSGRVVNRCERRGCRGGSGWRQLIGLTTEDHVLSLLLAQLQDGYSSNNGSNGGSQQCVSQPATPGGALPVPSPLSPSPASLSSYHGDDSDSISSPPWPLKTPSSPVRVPRTSIGHYRDKLKSIL